ncbi:hypothetical protein F4678DRAFT_238 [Xylaria arbuscula]|nr:hypothetical protein F4678DRAFT_238 [Xylaria arbuscula]
MAPTFTEHPSQRIVSSKGGWDLSTVTSKESKSSRSIIIYHVEQVWTKIKFPIKLLKNKAAAPKGTSIETDSGYGESPSPESLRSSDPSLSAEEEIEISELAVTELKIAELEADATNVGAPVLDPSPRVSNRPDDYYSGVSGRPGSQRSYGNRANGGAPSRPTVPPQPAQYSMADESFYDPNFPSTIKPVKFKGNKNKTNDAQVIGIDNSCIREEDVRQQTANVLAQRNVNLGRGPQILGQRVNPGAVAMCFSGDYSNNDNMNRGEQIIGFQFR